MGSELLARQDGPAALPPPPPAAYLEETEAPKMMAVNATLFSLAMLTAVLRVYVRAIMRKSFGLDDWIMVLAAALSVACFAIFVRFVDLGVGHHVEYFTYVKPENMMKFFFTSWWYAWLVVIAYCSTKISIALFLLRLADHRRVWRWVFRVIIIVLVLFGIGSVLSLILQCMPVAAAWDFSLRAKAKCYSTTTFRNTGVWNSTFNLFSDLLLAVLPIPMIWKLQTNVRTRLSLCIILGLGLFACGTAVYKIPLQYHFFDEKDWSGKGAWYYVWQQIELNVGIIAACLPTLKPLAAGFFGAVSALTSGERYGSRYANSNQRSRPFQSNGYLRQEERGGADRSYALEEMKGSRAKTPDSLEEDFKENAGAYLSNNISRKSRAGESDESILPLHKSGGILKTTEVEIS